MSTIITTQFFHKDLLVVDQSKLDVMSQRELVELAKDINGNAIRSAKQTLMYAGQTGFVLIALKEKIPRGRFLKYVEKLTEIPVRTAQTYMSIAVNYATVAHLGGVRDAIRFIRDASGRAKRLAGQSPAPSPQATYAPLVIEAEIVESSPEQIDDEPEVVVVDGVAEATEAPERKSKRLPKYIPNDAEELWMQAKVRLDNILPSDISREKTLNEVIAYCHGRLDAKRDALAAIVATIPRLTTDEVKSLIETLTARLP